MSQNKEATQFLSRIATLPRGPVSLDHVLQPSLDDEAELRKLFATDKGNTRLKDIHVGLVDVFAAPSDIRTTRARVVKEDADRDAQHIMALPSSLRREEGFPAMVESLEAFKKNWSIFTENSLSQLTDWSNAGTGSKRAMRKYFHEKAFPSSDVDIFLYGLTIEEAERKIVTIYEAVRDSVPWDVTCVRTKHTVSIHSQYPYRSIQIVLRLYSSPAEVLTGFDVDAPCCAYDGDRVWANPRAIVAMMRQSNIVDVTRRSPSYEVRLAKYSSRGFEVYVPGLKREEIDPTIYERGVGRVQGLARLLAIEKLATPEARSQYQRRRSLLRGRPVDGQSAYIRGEHRYKSDLKADAVFSGLEMSDYDIVNLHIPYGPGWDARRIERLIYKTDFGANSPYNPKNKNRRLHRHSAFFGTVEECIEDCCELCPEPKNEEEHNLQDEEDKSYVRGRIAFIEEDPGRQTTAKFFDAISKNDALAVKQMIEDEEDLTNRRDHVGRTPLHVAILSNSVEVGCVLIDAGARMTARLVGGRTSLHLAAQMGRVSLVTKMLERSAYNKKAEEKRKIEEVAAPKETDGVRMSSEDDWSSDESDDDKSHRKPPAYTKKVELEKDSDPLEDNEEEPDILDISIHDWDFGLTALGYAILSGEVEVVDALLAAGADPSFVAHTKNVNPLHPLTLTIYTQDEERAAKIAERLVAAQAISSTADDSLFTIFHRIVAAGKSKIVASLLSHDPNAKKVLNSPAWYGYGGLVFPIISTIVGGSYATLSVLLAHGAKLVYSPEDVSRAEEKRTGYLSQVVEYRARIYSPIETALGKRDEVISLLAALGANVDAPIKATITTYTQHTSLLQWTSKAVSLLGSKTTPKPIQAPDSLPDPPAGDSWSQYRAYLATVLPHCKDEDIGSASSQNTVHSRGDYAAATKDYFTFAESVLRAHGATLPEREPTSKQPATPPIGMPIPSQGSGYIRHAKHSTTPVPVHLKVFYDELYEACWNGDNASIRELCLPKQVAEGKVPIHIVVKTVALDNSLGASGCWTPFLVALYRRHWDTARLVLAIAKAQYQPPDTEIDGTSGMVLCDDSDTEGEYDSDEDDCSDYREAKPINFTDIAAMPSSVRTDVPPKQLLELQAFHLRPGLKRVSCKPLQKAIVEDDFEAFVHTLDLYEFAGVAIWPDSGAYDFAVALDRIEMLDELIRRSGVGIPIPSDAAKLGGAVSKKVPEERVYLGLKVGGKRRADIAKQGQTQRKTPTYNYDLLRSAIRSGATKVIDYLAGPRPIAAFTHYADTHNDDIAQYLKGIDNLGAVLTDLLGWKPDELNESPLLCAVIDNRIDVLKQLFALKPNLMEEALHLRVRSIGFNPLLTAAYYCSGTEIVDLLLEKGCDPSERDFRGWNIYHLACLSSNNKGLKFVEHLLKTLPEELTHELMTQTSREASNTPLMLAVKRENTAIARTILEFGINPTVLLLRDADGSTPLHVAVQNAATALAEALLKHGPTQLLYTENSVGQTPLDIASLKGLPRVTGDMGVPRATDLSVNVEHYLHVSQRSPPFDVEKQKTEIPKLRATLDMLLADGLLADGSKVTTELLAFAGRMEERLAVETARKNEGAKQAGEGEEKLEPGTTARTYFALRDAAAARPGTRQLVHLADVQRSVQRNLAQQDEGTLVRWSERSRVDDKDDKEGDPEVQRIGELKARSLFFQRIIGYGRVDVYGEDQV
ncbi:hypothetical protein EDB86DRAFT_3077358 [Lactarius hatsudake]|nr:hypothetical protein EDB86DRAFT_3077358 [Lactarius hatsudake]